jgi:phenylpropionate dioxygenase-like ring-hydroxylating dioxygenase large terminal subunit
MYVLNTWYAGAWSAELAPGAVLARTICDQPVVFYRSGDAVVALEDRCCHRGLPLALGRVEGDRLRCGYHGLEFDALGECVRVPGQTRIPPGARVRSYPTVEQDGIVWIWTGDTTRVQGQLPHAFPWHVEPGWAWRPQHTLMQCNYMLLSDNLLDLTHVGFVHGATLGGDTGDHAAAKLAIKRTDDSVRVARVMRDTIPGPFHVRAGGFTGRVDRYQLIEFTPGVVVIDSGMTAAGKLGPDCSVEPGTFNLNKVGFNGLTPETEHTTHYFWSMAHMQGAGDPAAEDAFFDDIKRTFDEDVLVLEHQYARRRSLPNATYIDVDFDVAALQARRIIERRISAERIERFPDETLTSHPDQAAHSLTARS